MKILVTGGAGFIGSHVTGAYVEAGHEVAVLDNFSTGKRENLPAGVRVFEGTIQDPDFVKQAMIEFQPEVVNHHAAQVSVTASVHEPMHDATLNILGTISVLQAAADTASVRKVIYASSGGAMYGNPATLPCVEDTVPNPVSPYGLSKYTAERYVWLFAATAPYVATVLRYSNVFGPRQDPHGEAGVCAIFAERMVGGSQDKKPAIFGDGSQVRDYVYVGDLATANVLALTKGDGGAYNIGTGQATTTMEVFEVLKAASNYPEGPVLAAPRAGEVQAIVLSPEKASKDLGWRPQVSFKEGIERTVAWYRR